MGMTLGREQLFHRILVFFAVFTAFTGIVNMCWAGTISLETLGSTTGVVSGQAVVDTSAYQQSSTSQTISGIDFTSGTDYSDFYTTYGYGTWSNTSSGLELINVGILNLISITPPCVILKNVVGSSDVYTVSYLIDNVPDEDFYLFPRFYIGDSSLARDDIRLKISQDGIHMQIWDTLGYWKDSYYYSYPSGNLQTTISGGSTYTLVFYETITDGEVSYDSHIEFYKDGIEYFYVDCLSISSNQFASGYTHAGAGSEHTGFIIKGFPSTTLSIRDTSTDTGSTGIDWLDAIISGISSVMSMVSSFFGSLGAILGIGQDALIPWWIWAIVAIPCIMTLGYMLIESITEAVP